MSVKEVKVWCCPEALGSFEKYPDGYNLMVRNKPAQGDKSAKLIFELEEPKREVTPSQFEDAWKKAKFGSGPDEFRTNIMSILFG